VISVEFFLQEELGEESREDHHGTTEHLPHGGGDCRRASRRKQRKERERKSILQTRPMFMAAVATMSHIAGAITRRYCCVKKK